MKKSGEKWGMALALNNLGVCARANGENDKSIEFHKQSLELFRELEDKRHVARMLINLGIDSRDKAEYDEASRLLSESLSLSREVGEKIGIAESLSYLGSVARRRGDFENAYGLLGESLIMSVELGNKELTAECLCEFAGCALARGEAERATRLFAACEKLRNAAALQVPPAYQEARERELAEARTALGEKRFAAEWSRGTEMGLEDAVAYTMTR
jgi:tetratricopeptide (TPR) repeat protein